MKKLAVVGGSYLQLPIVQKAKGLGYEVHCFAWLEGAVCKEVADYFYPVSTREKEEILKICREVEVDGIITIASDAAVATVNYVATALGLIANPERYTDITTNKYRMRSCFMEQGIPGPQFMLSVPGREEVLENFCYPLIVKPTDRSGSLGVEKVERKEDLPEAIERARKNSFSKEVIIEEFAEGVEVSVEAISWQGKHYILTITDKVTTGAPFFVELEHHQPSSLPGEIQEEVKAIVQKALTALHIEYGASHSELKIAGKGRIKVIEIGGRMGGDFIGSDLVRLSTGYDFLKGVVEVAMGNFIRPVIREHHCAGVYFLSQETAYLKEVIEQSGKYKEIVKAEITDPVLKNIECSKDRSGYLIYRSENKFKLK